MVNFLRTKIELWLLRKDKDQPQLRHRSDLHLARKGFHMSGAITFLVPFLFFDFSQEQMAAILGAALGGVMFIEYSRAKFKRVNKLAMVVLGPIMRDTEVNQLTGIPFYMASCLFAFLIFPKHIAALSILYLALGDPSSSFFGVLYGKNKIFPNKSLQGTLGGFTVCFFATLVYLYFQDFPREKLLLISLIGGFSGSLAELLPLNIDDNFSIPVVSGFLMILAFWSCTGYSGVHFF
ncbi:MAG: SEC59/DGK1/VTE5 family protein [Oligoflexia bacterium]|nr:SEC59/DGK1/VTE5 family protein [Oligoflexia bacterium]